MVTTRQTTHRMLYGPRKPWSHLPPEIRLRILKLVAQDHEPKGNVGAASVAPYAAVCPEWQFFFEQITFNYLILGNSTLEAFKKVVGGSKKIRLGYIRHLWLRIKLPKYSCPSCEKAESGLTISQYVKV